MVRAETRGASARRCESCRTPRWAPAWPLALRGGTERFCFPGSALEKGGLRVPSDSGWVGSNFRSASQEKFTHVFRFAPTLTNMGTARENHAFFE